MRARIFASSVLIGAFLAGTFVALHKSVPLVGTIDAASSAPAAPVVHKTNGRREFGHPLVPGGIHSLGELAKHLNLYSGLVPSHAVFTTSKVGVFAYVSYIKNGVIYWTKRQRFIRAGEPVIVADGFVILQNCGNAVRSDAPAAVETLGFGEPDDLYPPVVADTPMPAPEMPETTTVLPPSDTSALTVASSSTPSDTDSSIFVSPTTIAVGGGFGGFGSLPPATVVRVAEPSSGEMLALAVLLLLCITYWLERGGK